MTTTPYETDRYQPSGYSDSDESYLNPGAAIDAELSGEQEADELDTIDTVDEDDSTDEGGAGSKAKASTKPSRGLFRRVAAKTIEVQGASDTVRALAAAQVGGSEDVVELVASIMSAGRSSTSPLTDIETIQAAIRDEPWSVGITATALGRARLKSIWTLLHTLGAVGTPAPPASDAKAGLAVAKAVNGLSEDNQLELVASAELLKRS
ncbi:hypothetical protein Achl_4399 (plasmid) [Pseudarthrobacter chlorophenolicus A6]|uniref:Uncharacterized protein n=1 Tax=Pseudarthrobacter chlorophenolicus (strain ATCC 700700 / DSM 12829 / CIP 107037 / JCM 12360 / KCTC 9906 / NCIMB 13794 / A6) TaxID=452863 RepID=B8HIV3_PSECP|nr:hypothetical protein [Pseudarthrobacter chlorophenolicus]ACL42350.1 hypothetical protein Achl_4399 [Pseudarthrobacter chlorophenolicus A6]SDQ16876.1 hypothetical protein SAMN04489738_0456 [Pseudarthrobacter chlorophenolicus]